MMVLTLLAAFANALVLGTVTETAIAASHREGLETYYAAEAAVELGVQELAAAVDWGEIAAGSARSNFVDGPPSGTRQVGAVTVDLTAATADISTASVGESGPVTYHLYAYGSLAAMITDGARRSPYYVATWIAGLASDTTDDLTAIRIVGRAYGPTGSRRSMSVTVSRASATDELRVVSWHELR
jgi:hypothetical protein